MSSQVTRCKGFCGESTLTQSVPEDFAWAQHPLLQTIRQMLEGLSRRGKAEIQLSPNEAFFPVAFGGPSVLLRAEETACTQFRMVGGADAGGYASELNPSFAGASSTHSGLMDSPW